MTGAQRPADTVISSRVVSPLLPALRLLAKECVPFCARQRADREKGERATTVRESLVEVQHVGDRFALEPVRQSPHPAPRGSDLRGALRPYA